MCGPGAEMELLMEMEEEKKLEISKKDKKELEKLLKEITEEAKKVVEDYVKNPSQFDSGSAIQLHPDSPILKEK